MIKSLQSEPGRLTENYLGTVGFSIYELYLPSLLTTLKGFGGVLPIAITENFQVDYLNKFCQWAENQEVSSHYLGYNIQRTPGFTFQTQNEAILFISWLSENGEQLSSALLGKSKHLKFLGYELLTENNPVLVCLKFDTGDAAGQNMVTLAAQRMINWVKDNCPIKFKHAWIDPNASGDKKPAALTKVQGRGGKCFVEWLNPNLFPKEWQKLEALRNNFLKEDFISNRVITNLAGILLSFGQDLACIVETAGKGSLSINSKHHTISGLYNGQVWGSVGGGTRLPSAQMAFEKYFGGTPAKQDFIECITRFQFMLTLFDTLEYTGC